VPLTITILIAALAAAAGVTFTDVTRAAGLGSVLLVSGGESKDYILETIGTGVAAFDFDNDGHQDLYFANGSRLEGFPQGKEPLPSLFRGRGDGTFEDVSASSGLAEHFWGFGVAVGDYDNDGFTDLYVTAYGPDRLYHNQGDGTFRQVAQLSGIDDSKWGASAAFSDFDDDGLLDLYVANYVAFDTRTVPKKGDPDHPCLYRGATVMCGPKGLQDEVDILYRNNGDGTFSDLTAASGIRTDIGMFGLGVATADYDEDGDIDIYVANDATPNQLYRNRGDGTFDEVGAMSGVAYGPDGVEQGSMGTSFGDYDGDGHLDIAVTNFSHQSYQVLRYAGDGFFEDMTFATGVGQATFLSLGWATDFFDYDHDGDLDLFFANGHVYPDVDQMQIGTTYQQTNQLMRNDAAPEGGSPASSAPGGYAPKAFEDVSGGSGDGFTTRRSYRGGGPVDFDEDGDLDLILTVIDGTPALLRNDGGSTAGRWAQIKLVGASSNRSAIGARLVATAGGRRMVRNAGGGGSYLWSCDPWIHFGLSGSEKIDELEVWWPSGARQQIKNLKANRRYILLEGKEATPIGSAAKGAGA